MAVLGIASTSAVAGLWAVSPQAALAAGGLKCNPAGGPFADGSQICIDVWTDGSGNHVEGSIAGSGLTNITLAVDQCDGTGANCSAIWQGHTNDSGELTPALGHTYYAIGSWTGITGTRHTAVKTALSSCGSPVC